MATITSKVVTKFLWKNISCRFRVLESIIIDNNCQFDSDHYREWCTDLGIKAKYSSPGHPQANGQAEATNKSLLNILKKKVGDKKGDWAEELPGVLWAYRTSEKTPTGEAPFTLAYGCEAVAPVEIGLPSHRTSQFSPQHNNAAIEEHLDLIEEQRDMAEARTAREKLRAERYFNKRVKPRSFKVGDLVLRKSGVTTQSEGKMGSRWEGPYIVVANSRPGSYRLKDEQGRELPHPWNAEHLRKYFQ